MDKFYSNFELPLHDVNFNIIHSPESLNSCNRKKEYEIKSSSLGCYGEYLNETKYENQHVITDSLKEFRQLFLEDYLEKNSIGRKSKFSSKSKSINKINFLCFVSYLKKINLFRK